MDHGSPSRGLNAPVVADSRRGSAGSSWFGFNPVEPANGSRAEIDAFLAAHTDQDYLDDIRAGAAYLKTRAAVADKPVGILGICSGGRRALLYAARFDGIGAVVAYHTASMTTTAEVAAVTAPTQLHHGTGDKVSSHQVSITVSKGNGEVRSVTILPNTTGGRQGSSRTRR